MIVEAAANVAKQAAGQADEIEASQRLPATLLQAMIDADLFQMYVRESVGGPAHDPLTAFLAVETLSRVDASVGWLSMVSATTGWITGYLTDEVLRSMVGSPCDLRIAGSSKPLGVAVAAPGGYRINGRWDFSSGITHANWVMAGCLIEGRNEMRLFFVPASDVVVDENWSVVGMRGTGSHDMVISDLFVPHERVASPTGDAFDSHPIYSQRIMRVATHGPVAAVALGLARGALDDLFQLAEQPTSLNAKALRDRPEAQVALALNTARLNSVRAYAIDAIGRAWESLSNERDPSLPVAEARTAFAYSARMAARVIDEIVEIIGTPMVRTTSPLQRRVRDFAVARHFPSFDIGVLQNAGRVLFGLPPETSGW